ncbi:hypothetical protein DRW03_03405 [Corallococcus sp. H22C18031201]|nr:hypothetical protein DRW03_03405 [Corallococcus sp. H22C18031201]
MTTRFGRFELLERLNFELHGVRYRALDTTAPEGARTLELLRLPLESNTEESWLERYRQGAQLAMQLRHNNIVQVLEFGVIDGEYFLGTAALDGKELVGVLHNVRRTQGHRGIPAPIAVSIFIDVCRALHFAHTLRGEHGESLGMTHDALCLTHIHVLSTGEVKLGGFGTGRLPPPRTEGVMGPKVMFFSPEMIRGGALDARSDVYVAGVVLYRLLCDQLPFMGEHESAWFDSARNDQLIPLTTRVPTMDARLSEILQRAMRADPTARYESAEALGQALSAWLQAQTPSMSAAELQEARRQLLVPQPNPPQKAEADTPARAFEKFQQALARLPPRR